MQNYYTTVGLEIHAELHTDSKMFCSCKNDPEEKIPNKNVCPVCLAHPGTLPVINKKAVESVIRVGLAVGGDISSEFTEFDRKNYFYPDIPKAYQLSQYKYPIVSGGTLAGVKLTRVHLEEDTATSKHDKGDYSLVDFNRAGVPLMELVTEPVIHTPEEAGNFARELQLLLRYLGVSEANMEKGQMRVEANISVSPDPEKFGTKVEVKNLNSFKSAERAIAYEVKRMIDLIEKGAGKEIVQETRGFDETKGTTFSQRSKENAQDYRYFPDPDLPKLVLKEIFDIPKLKSELPELPNQKRLRYAEVFGIKQDDIESYIQDETLATYFEGVSEILKDTSKITLASNYILSDLVGLIKKDQSISFPPKEDFAELIELLAKGDISSRTAKDLLAILHIEKKSPKMLAEEKGLIQKNDPEAIKKIINTVIEANPTVASDFKNGKEQALMFLVGQVMKEGKGAVNPTTAKELLIQALS